MLERMSYKFKYVIEYLRNRSEGNFKFIYIEEFRNQLIFLKYISCLENFLIYCFFS